MDLRKKLEDELILCKWGDVVHFSSKAEIIFVSDSLSIVDVAIAFAKDEVEDVKAWIASRHLRRNEENDKTIASKQEIDPCRLLVVAPFALVQFIEAPTYLS